MTWKWIDGKLSQAALPAGPSSSQSLERTSQKRNELAQEEQEVRWKWIDGKLTKLTAQEQLEADIDIALSPRMWPFFTAEGIREITGGVNKAEPPLEHVLKAEKEALEREAFLQVPPDSTRTEWNNSCKRNNDDSTARGQ